MSTTETKMVTRKLVWLNGSHYVALPAEFLRKWHLTKGDQVEITIYNQGLLITRPQGDRHQ